MDLSTRYMGIPLRSPFVAGASPLADTCERARRLEEAGAGAVVVRSLFTETIALQQINEIQGLAGDSRAFAEALRHLPRRRLHFGPDEYLQHLAELKQALDIPVIASLNAARPGAWTSVARAIDQTGADAIELNVYDIPTDPLTSAADVESRLAAIVAAVAAETTRPIAVKLSPFVTALPNLATSLAAEGADGLVLFNRFCQPDIDISGKRARRVPSFSTPEELLLRIHWLAILSGRAPVDLAASGGVHSAEGALKALMAGASVVQVVSCLLERGDEYLATLTADLEAWLDANEHATVAELCGCMSLENAEEPDVWERTSYMEMLDYETPERPAST